MRTHELLIDDLADDTDEPFSFPEIKRELSHDDRDDGLGFRSLLEQPERVMCDRLSRLTPTVLYRRSDWNSAA